MQAVSRRSQTWRKRTWLPLHEAARSDNLKLFRSSEERALVESARQRLAEVTRRLAAASPEEARSIAGALRADDFLSVVSDRERARLQDEAFTTYAEAVLADDHLTAEEEDVFGEIADALAITQESLESGKHHDIFLRLAIAKVNDGRLGRIEQPHLIPKKGEVVHLETAAGLMKEVTLREFRGGSRGVSFPVAKGVRYRVGNFRGRSVVVGTELRVQDGGVLAVTSLRVAFLGDQKAMEVPYSKLMGVEVFDDGIRLQAANRQNAVLFKVDSGLGQVIAATINAAAQDTL